MKIFEMIVGLATLLGVVLAYVFRRRRPVVSAISVFIIIWMNAAGLFLKIFLFALTKEGGERAVLVVTSVVGPSLVAVYWHRYWQGKRPDKKQIQSGPESRS